MPMLLARLSRDELRLGLLSVLGPVGGVVPFDPVALVQLGHPAVFVYFVVVFDFT